MSYFLFTVELKITHLVALTLHRDTKIPCKVAANRSESTECVYSFFAVVSPSNYFQLFNLCLRCPGTMEILLFGERYKLLQFVCESSCVRTKNT